jgi:hypothetical protein
MTSTVNNGTFTLSGLTGATVQGSQYRDTGIVRVGNGNATTLNDGITGMAACEFLELQIGNASSLINFSNVSLRITSGVDDAFGTNKYLSSSGTGVSLTMDGCLVSSPNSRLIMRGTGHDAILRDCVFNIVGMALFGTGTIISNVTIIGMGSAVSSGLGIRETFSTPISGLIVKDSTNGINLFGAAVGTIQNASISNTTYHFYIQVDASTDWTGRLDGINLISNWSFFWSRPSGSRTFSGLVRRINTFDLTVIDASNAAISGVQIYINDTLGNNYINGTTNGSGQISQLQLIRNVYTFGGAFNSTTTTDTTRLPYLKRYRKYGLRFFQDLSFEFSSAISESAKILADPYVTAANSAAALAITNPSTAAQAYDHAKATYAGSTFMQHAEAITTDDGLTLNIDANVTLNTSLSAVAYTPATPAISYSALALAGSFTGIRLGASRTIDLVQAATYAAPWSIPATGIVTVADGTTNLSSWTFASGATINRRAGATASTVQVASVTGITAGAGVTLSAPTLTVNITGLLATTRLKIFDTGTQTLVAGINSSSTSFSWSGATIGNGYDIYVVLPGYGSLVITNYIYPSSNSSLPVIQVVDTNYSATGSSYDLDTSGGAGLGTTTDLWLDTANREIQLATGNKLVSTTGIPLVNLYSKIIEGRYANDSLMPYHDPIVCLDEDAGKYELRRGWKLKNNTTRNLLRSGGLAQYSSGGSLQAEYIGLVGLGSLASTITPYYWQINTTNPALTNCINTGQPNQLVQVYGDASNGNFDYRSYFVISARKQGENPSTYNLIAEQSLSTLESKLYNVVLSTTTNTNLTVADTSIDANSDGTADVAPYTGMSITWLTSAATADWANATVYAPFARVESVGFFWITVNGGTSSGTSVSNDTGVTDWRKINTVYDANNGTLDQMTNYLFWAQRQTVDIDSGTGNRTGRVVSSLATTEGANLILRSGLWAINFNASARNTHFPTNLDGVRYSYTLPNPVVNVTVTGPSDYYVTIIQSGSRLNTSDTGIQTGAYTFTTSATGSAIVRVRRQGWRDFQTTITLTSGATSTVGALLTQETGGAGNPLYAGTTSTLITVTVDAADTAHKINWTGNGSANAQLVYDEIHDAKVSAAGMLVSGLQVNYLRVIPFLEAIILPSTVKFRNQTPANLNCEFIGFASQAAGALVDDGGGSGAIRVVASLGVTQQQVADAALLAPTVGLTPAALSLYKLVLDMSTSGALTVGQAAQLLALYNATTAGTGATVFSTAALGAITVHTRPMAKQLGLISGVTATHTPTGITVSDADGSTTITDNGSGSYTVQKVP